MNRIPLIFTISCFIIYKLIALYTHTVYWGLLIFLLPITLLILNLSLRNKLKYKSWFKSKLNLLLERNKFEFESEISSDLLFEKLQEVLADSEFKLLDTDIKNKSILFGTTINLLTWGENVYIELIELSNGNTRIDFTAISLFGSSSWKLNQQHYKTFISSFEASLTI